jgi:hypothetical protein
MTESRNPRNIPVRENFAAGDSPVAATSPGDANPDLERSASPGPVPRHEEPARAREHAGPSEAATRDIEERQKVKSDDDDHGRPAADAPVY